MHVKRTILSQSCFILLKWISFCCNRIQVLSNLFLFHFDISPQFQVLSLVLNTLWEKRWTMTKYSENMNRFSKYTNAVRQQLVNFLWQWLENLIFCFSVFISFLRLSFFFLPSFFLSPNISSNLEQKLKVLYQSIWHF